MEPIELTPLGKGLFELEKGHSSRKLGEGDLADLRYGGIDRACNPREPTENNKFYIPPSLAEGKLGTLTISHDGFYQDNNGESQKIPETVLQAIGSMQEGQKVLIVEESDVLGGNGIGVLDRNTMGVRIWVIKIMRIYAKTEECRHQKMVFFPDTEFTVLNSESDSLELTAFASETDKEDVDESAVDDDWEDSDESESDSINEKTFFHRVNTLPNLTTRRSLITLALRSTPARPVSINGSSLRASPDSNDESFLIMKTNLKPTAEIYRSGSAPQPIIQTTTNGHYPQLALSPRTNRRNMLATELTVSLRQHLLWERQQKSQTANAVLKRKHTADNVAELKQHPDKVHIGNENSHEIHASWKQYLRDVLSDYHSNGW